MNMLKKFRNHIDISENEILEPAYVLTIRKEQKDKSSSSSYLFHLLEIG